MQVDDAIKLREQIRKTKERKRMQTEDRIRYVSFAKKLGLSPFDGPELSVYVAGPLSASTRIKEISNIHHAFSVAEAIHERGWLPIIPHLFCLWHHFYPHDRTFWLELDLQLLSRCNAMVRIIGTSEGSDLEALFAKDQGIPIFHINVDDATRGIYIGLNKVREHFIMPEK